MIPRSNEIRFEVTTKCNKHCHICPREKLTRKIETMDFELFRKLLDKVLTETTQYNTVTFSGYGEPTLDITLAQKMRYAQSKGFKILLLTNNHKANYGVPTRYSVVLENEIAYIARDNGNIISIEIWKPHNWIYGRNYRKIQKKRLKTCGRPYNGPLEIQVNGTVKMCCFDFDGRLQLGDLKIQTLEEIFTKPFSHNNLMCSVCDQLNPDRKGTLIYSSEYDNEKRVKLTSTVYEQMIGGNGNAKV